MLIFVTWIKEFRKASFIWVELNWMISFNFKYDVINDECLLLSNEFFIMWCIVCVCFNVHYEWADRLCALSFYRSFFIIILFIYFSSRISGFFLIYFCFLKIIFLLSQRIYFYYHCWVFVVAVILCILSIGLFEHSDFVLMFLLYAL